MISFAKIGIDVKAGQIYTLGMSLMLSTGLILVPDTLESVCIEIKKPKAKPILLTTVYRPPDSTVEIMDVLENYLNSLANKAKN